MVGGDSDYSLSISRWNMYYCSYVSLKIRYYLLKSGFSRARSHEYLPRYIISRLDHAYSTYLRAQLRTIATVDKRVSCHSKQRRVGHSGGRGSVNSPARDGVLFAYHKVRTLRRGIKETLKLRGFMRAESVGAICLC